MEILAMVLGFIVFWPIGLAILLLKLWQKRSGYEGDLVSFARDRLDAVFDRSRAERSWPHGSHHWGSWPRSWYGAQAGMSPTGNLAFDEWRAAELARLEEERQKLVAAEREFAEFMENLRRARDREEFERFMEERRHRQGGPGEAH